MILGSASATPSPGFIYNLIAPVLCFTLMEYSKPLQRTKPGIWSESWVREETVHDISFAIS